MITLKKLFRNAVTLCTIMSASVSIADDGVVRMSDRGSRPVSQPAVHQTGFLTGDSGGPACGDSCGESCYIPQPCPSQCCPAPCYQGCDPCQMGMGNNGGCDSGMCYGGDCYGNSGYGNSCYTPTDCNSCFSGCDHSGRRGRWGNQCDECNGGRGLGRGFGRGNGNGRNGRVGYCDGNGCDNGCRHGFGNCGARRNNLCDCLFGWMIPSGFCGQGLPPVGKYHMTYADQPSHIDPRDTKLYAAQGYGMPMSVPLAPNVNHAYNYSSGLPASRVTHIGSYNPMTSPQRLPCQTW